jgi:hypothetical protein
VNACKTELVPLDICAVNKKACGIKKHAEGYGAPLPPIKTRSRPQHQRRAVCSAAGIKLKEGGDKGAFSVL